MNLISYARSFLGTPYLWGGSSPQGWDCSGFVQELLSYAGCDPIGDQTAQGLFNHFAKHGKISDPKPGALVFYGKAPGDIRHISMCTSENTVIEAGGGDSTCTTKEIAAKKAAFVRERPFSKRNDVIAVIMPVYPDWALKGDL